MDLFMTASVSVGAHPGRHDADAVSMPWDAAGADLRPSSPLGADARPAIRPPARGHLTEAHVAYCPPHGDRAEAAGGAGLVGRRRANRRRVRRAPFRRRPGPALGAARLVARARRRAPRP